MCPQTLIGLSQQAMSVEGVDGVGGLRDREGAEIDL